jgi:hypothetical protein|tara:strand:- start:593 stop:1285 length:693 start_codon:yes stop_codon:yes gene_type:complete
MTVRRRLHFPLSLNSLTKKTMKLYGIRLEIGRVEYKVVWPGVLVTELKKVKTENLFIVRRVDENQYAAAMTDYKYIFLSRTARNYKIHNVGDLKTMFNNYTFPITALRKNILEIEVPGMEFKEYLPCFPQCFFIEKPRSNSKRKKRQKDKSDLNPLNGRGKRRINDRAKAFKDYKGWVVVTEDSESALKLNRDTIPTMRQNIVRSYIDQNSNRILAPFIKDLFLNESACS